MRTTRLVAATSLLVGVALLGGCAAADTPAPRTSTTSTTTRTTSPPPAALTILAMGDSTVWDHDCVDCTHSYPHLIRAALAASTGKEIALIDATQQNGLTAPPLLDEITHDSWGAATQDPKAPAPKPAIAAADIVTITLGANDAPWQRDDDPVCSGDWAAKSCIDQKVAPSLAALGRIIDAIHSIRGTKPTAIRVTNFYNELIASKDYLPDRPAEWVAKGRKGAKVFSDALNDGICATAVAHRAVCIDIYHGINGADGTTALPANWFMWSGHDRGYDQTFTADAIMRTGFAPVQL